MEFSADAIQSIIITLAGFIIVLIGLGMAIMFSVFAYKDKNGSEDWKSGAILAIIFVCGPGILLMVFG